MSAFGSHPPGSRPKAWVLAALLVLPASCGEEEAPPSQSRGVPGGAKKSGDTKDAKEGKDGAAKRPPAVLSWGAYRQSQTLFARF
mgnify:CR=1 FL=1